MSKVKYIHLRDRDIFGVPLAKGGATIAYVIDLEKDEVRFAFAECHPKDAYDKSKGRIKAEGKLNSKKHTFSITYENRTNREIVDDIKERYLEIFLANETKSFGVYRR